MMLFRRWRPPALALRSASTLTRDAAPPSALDAAYRLVLGADSSDSIRVAVEQARAVEAAVAGYSVFLHLPTGAGKSLAFQVPALLAPPGATTLVISPLIALMHDQVANLKRKGVDAVHVSGERTRQAASSKQPLRDLLANKRLVYTTPEFLIKNREMREWMVALRDSHALNRIVLDEAHCVLDWGNSFRPAYLELGRWKARHFARVPVTLATATVLDQDMARLAEIFQTQIVASDSLENGASPSESRAKEMLLVQNVTDRPNLRLEVVHKNASQAPALIHARVGNAPTIVYCLTRREVEAVCLELVRLGTRAGVYHGGLPAKRREFVRKQWMGGQISVICATSAFGMGIDRGDVRFVVHHSLPLSLVAYYQQIGRAGRDGKPAVCMLLYAAEDKSLAHAVTTERVDETDGSTLSAGASYLDVEEVAAFCESTDCRRAHIASHFGHEVPGKCIGNCNCGPMEEPAALAVAPLNDTPKTDNLDAEIDSEPSSVQVELYYHKVLTEAKKCGLPKREALSRRAIREILRAEPASVEAMGELRGVGQDKAERYFDVFSFR